MPLLSDFAKELSLGIPLVLDIVNVGRDVDEIFFELLDDLVIGEYGRTARNAIVSDTAQWIAVHRPNKYWFLFFISQRNSRP